MGRSAADCEKYGGAQGLHRCIIKHPEHPFVFDGTQTYGHSRLQDIHDKHGKHCCRKARATGAKKEHPRDCRRSVPQDKVPKTNYCWHQSIFIEPFNYPPIPLKTKIFIAKIAASTVKLRPNSSE
jgi:hypothetical protein